MKKITIVSTITALVVSFIFASQAHALLSLKGKIHSIDMAKGEFSIKENDSGRVHVFAFSDATTVKLDNRVYTDLSALSPGDEVIYRKHDKQEKRVDYVSVTIRDLDLENRRITVINNATGREQTLAYTASAERADGRRGIEASRLRVGEEVMLKLEQR